MYIHVSCSLQRSKSAFYGLFYIYILYGCHTAYFSCQVRKFPCYISSLNQISSPLYQHDLMEFVMCLAIWIQVLAKTTGFSNDLE